LAYSRVLGDEEVLIVINTDPEQSRGWRPGTGLGGMTEVRAHRRSALAPEGFISLEPFGWAIWVSD
jgi:hypothetical protein